MNYFLPEISNFRLSFLQKVIEDKKYILERDQIKHGWIHSYWPEFSVKNVWPLVKSSRELTQYLPSDEMNEGRYPNKDWFWGIAYTIIPVWTKAYKR